MDLLSGIEKAIERAIVSAEIDGKYCYSQIIEVFLLQTENRIGRQVSDSCYMDPVKRETGENPVRTRHCI